MTEGIADIRRRIRSVESTEHITNAMRLVSAARFRRAREQYDRTGAQLEEVLERMEPILGNVMAPQQSAERKLLVVMTSSRGLCGGYNSSILKAAEEILDEDCSLYFMGAKGESYFKRKNRKTAGSMQEPAAGPKKGQDVFRNMKTASDTILQEYLSGGAGEIWLVHTAYRNTLKQEPEVKRILPIETGARCGPEEQEDRMEFEPERSKVQAQLLPKYLQLALYRAWLEAEICEHAARRTAMESATDNAREMLSALSVKMNRARQQAITDELIEIVSGAEAMR